MGNTHWSGPLLGDNRSLGGALEEFGVHVAGQTDGVTYFNDFIGNASYDATNDFTLTAITGGTAGFLATGETGILRLDAPAQNQGPIVQLDSAGIGITPAAGTTFAMGARFALADAEASDLFVGLAELNATSAVLTAAGALTSDNHIGFHLLNADNGALRFSTAGTSVIAALTTESITTLEDATYVDVAVRVTNTQGAEGYIKVPDTGGWRRVANITSALWNDTMFPTLAVVGDADGDDLDVDYIWAARTR